MLSDRSYMREETPNAALKPLAWIVGGLVVAFLAQSIAIRTATGAPVVENWFELSADATLKGRVWTVLSYAVLHDPANLLHLIFNVLGFVFLGRTLLPLVGIKRFATTCISGVLAGGLLWLAVHIARTDHLIGASAAVSALFGLFCCLFANERMTVLLFFVIPVTVVPKYLLMFWGGATTLFFLFAELFPIGSVSGMAHSAHLGGLIAGIVCYRYFKRADETPEEPATSLELPRWLAKKKPTSAAAVAEKYKANLPPNRADLKAEVDRILDKINTSGFGSLTADEKRTLDEARDLLSKR